MDCCSSHDAGCCNEHEAQDGAEAFDGVAALSSIWELSTHEIRNGVRQILGYLLGKESHTDSRAPYYGPLIGLGGTSQDLQESGLAFAVPPYEPDTLTGFDPEAGPIQKGPVPEYHSKVLTADQRHEGLFRVSTARNPREPRGPTGVSTQSCGSTSEDVKP